MRKISKLLFVITALAFTLSFGVISNSPAAYATSGGGGNEQRCSDFNEASDRTMCTNQYDDCVAATGGNDCMDRAVTYTQENGTQAPSDEEGAVCSAGALGWVLCPLNEAMVAMLEGIGALLEGFLTFQPLTNSDQGDAIRTIWGSVLAMANSGLVIVFLIVIFSQATSIGLSSYGIKRLLPRIIAAAVLMNLSFFICAIAVDLSNILGISVKAIVDVGIQQVGMVDNPDLQQGAGIGSWIGVIAGTLLATGIAAATGAIYLLVPVLISGVLAALTALIIIAARQVLITLLIIIAPLAILAWILPNTEQWFTKWRSLMTTLLLMFPMVMAIFYGAVLVSNVTLLAATQGDSALNDFTINLLAFLVLVVPLFSIPFVIKSAGGVLDRIGVLANNRNKGLVDRASKKAEEWKGNTAYQRGLAIRRQGRDNFRNEKFAKKMEKGGFARVRAEGVPGLRNRVLDKADEAGLFAANSKIDQAMLRTMQGSSGAQRQALTRSASAMVDKAFEQSVADASTRQKSYSSDRLDAMSQGKSQFKDASGQMVSLGQYNEADQVAAARWVMSNGNFAQRKQLYESIGKDTSERLRQTVSQQYYAKGDNSVIGSAYGGALLEGVAGDENARKAVLEQNVAKNIVAKKVTASAMVHDADATSLISDVARNNALIQGAATDKAEQEAKKVAIQLRGQGATPTQAEITAALSTEIANTKSALAEAANESLVNENTRTKAVAGVYKQHIDAISSSMSAGAPPNPSPAGGGNAGQLIIPRGPAGGAQQGPPTPTQQQRQQGGNFGGGPAQNIPPANPPTPPRNPPTPPTPPFNPPNNP